MRYHDIYMIDSLVDRMSPRLLLILFGVLYVFTLYVNVLQSLAPEWFRNLPFNRSLAGPGNFFVSRGKPYDNFGIWLVSILSLFIAAACFVWYLTLDPPIGPEATRYSTQSAEMALFLIKYTLPVGLLGSLWAYFDYAAAKKRMAGSVPVGTTMLPSHRLTPSENTFGIDQETQEEDKNN